MKQGGFSGLRCEKNLTNGNHTISREFFPSVSILGGRDKKAGVKGAWVKMQVLDLTACLFL